MTAARARAFRAQANRRVSDSFRGGVPAGVVIVLAVAVVGHLTTPPETYALPLGLLGVALLLAGRALLGVAWVARRPNLVVLPCGLYFALCIAHGAALLGGFDGVAAALGLHVMIFGSAVVPLSPRDFVLHTGLIVSATMAVMAVSAPHRGFPWWYLAVVGTGAGVVAAAAVLRDRMQQRTFLTLRELAEAHRRLAEHQAALARLNGELEAQVRAQVGEIVDRSRDLEALNAQLRAQVRERSRELDDALRRVAVHGGPAGLAPGTLLGGRARVVAFLGAGAMGEVYLADDLATGRRVAVKTLRARRAADGEDVRRFLHEATALAQLAHPAIVGVLHVDVGEDGRLFLILEHVDGETLAARLRRGPLAVDEAAGLGEAIAAGLAAAHAAGVIHRDVKPANVMLTAEAPGARLLDFGLAKLSAPLALGVTACGVAVGTPRYMAPEQREGRPVTGAADVYALGVLLDDMVGGRPSPPLAALLERARDPAPERRPTARELGQSLAALAPALSRPRRGAGSTW